MKTFHRYIISSTPIGTKEIKDVEVFNPAVKYQNTFTIDPALINSLPVRSNFDVAEAYKKTKHIKAHSIFFHLTEAEWARFNAGENRWGASWFVVDRIISIGRWHDNGTYKKAYKYDEPVKSLAELTIGLAHEEAHKIHSLLGYTNRRDDCHYHFYGMTDRDADDSKSANRWRRTPTPIEYYESFDWGRLSVIQQAPEPTPIVNSIAIHHTEVSRSEARSQLQAVNRYHKEKWNSKSSLGYYVGYNFFVDVNGVVTHAREVGTETIAQTGHNCTGGSCAISVCLAGDFNRELPSDAQIESTKELLEFLLTAYPNVPVVGHRDLQADRTCPGVLMTPEYIRVRLLGEVPPTPPDEQARKEALRKQLREAQITLIGLLRKYVKILTGRLNK